MNNGFIKGPVISADLVEKLWEKYNLLKNLNPESGFFTSTFSTNTDYRRKANDYILELLQPVLDSAFDNYQILYANFMVKPPGAGSVCDLHQDWTYVDEEKYYTLNIWIPLLDIDVNNGTIHFIKASHSFDKRVRGRDIWWPYFDRRQHMVDTMVTAVPLKAGEAAIFNSKTFHYSPPNNTSNTRVAVSVVVTFKEADLVHYFTSNGNIFKSPVNPAYFVDYGFNSTGYEKVLKPVWFADAEEYKKVVNAGLLNKDEVAQ